MTKVIKNTFLLSLLLGILIVFVLGIFSALVFSIFPSDKEIKGCLVTKMHNINLCPGSKAYVRISQISPFLRKAILISEDSAFYQHNGFDFQELEKSLKKNLEKGKFARGGSTITQQLAKNLFLTKEKTLKRKFLEALIAIRIEKILSKNEIFERYLNVVQFGKNIFGIKEAANFYFKKLPSELTITESSFLAFLLPNPEIYSKSFYKKQLTPFATKRLNEILDHLYRYHQINEVEYSLALEELNNFLSTKATDESLIIPDNIESIDEENSTEDL